MHPRSSHRPSNAPSMQYSVHRAYHRLAVNHPHFSLKSPRYFPEEEPHAHHFPHFSRLEYFHPQTQTHSHVMPDILQDNHIPDTTLP